MPIKYLRWISRDDVRAEPAARFVFGDNVERVGLGGQAGSMRGEPNAIGVATKWSPSSHHEAFYSDDDPACVAVLNADIDLIAAALDAGQTVYVPFDGLGTGLSELPTRAPQLHRHIIERFKEFSGETCPWQV